MDVPDSFVAQTKVKTSHLKKIISENDLPLVFTNFLIEFKCIFFSSKKTPPKYPPPSLGVEREDQARSSGSSFSQLSISNGHSNRRSFPGKSFSEKNFFHDFAKFSKENNLFTEPPPSRPSRDHIRIEKDGQLFNTMEPPPLIRDQQPTPEQSQRIKRYGEDIGKTNNKIMMSMF